MAKKYLKPLTKMQNLLELQAMEHIQGFRGCTVGAPN